MPDNFLTQNQSIRQEQTISARQMQSLELLHAPVQELLERLNQELAVNPVLEQESPSDDIPLNEPPADDERELSGDDGEMPYDSGDEWHDELPIPGVSASGDSAGREHLFNSLASEESMTELLLEELRVSSVSGKTAQIAEVIIGSLDERGFLQSHPADIAMAADASMEEVEEALALVQSFDPPGIGARTLAECLLLQLARAGEDDPKLVELITNHLDDVGRNRLPQIAREMRITVTELDALLKKLRRLNPSPGYVYARDSGGYVAPEVVIEQDLNGNYTVFPSGRLPKIIIPDRYFAMLEEPELSPEDKAYIREKIASARDLLKALDLRDSTIRRIASLIAESQKEFFDGGVEFLKPMTMRQAAEELGVHETTVSRAIAGKYLQTPGGLFPFRYFFSSGFVNEEGEAVSSKSVQELIRQIVEDEDPAHPLSDDKISKLLSEKGVNVARRTVAKYRDELGIPGTSQRRRYF